MGMIVDARARRHAARLRRCGRRATAGRMPTNPILCAMRARVLATRARATCRPARICSISAAVRGGRRSALARERLPGDRDRLVARDGATRRAGACVGAGVDRSRRRPARRHPRARSAAPPARFDAAYSNFGPLNCVADLPAAARAIASRLRPGGVLVASVIGRVCPWEIALYPVAARLARAAVRFRAARAGAARGTDGVDAVLHARGVRAIFASRPASRASSARARPVRAAALLQAFAARHPALVDGAAARRGSVRRLAGAPRSAAITS